MEARLSAAGGLSIRAGSTALRHPTWTIYHHHSADAAKIAQSPFQCLVLFRSPTIIPDRNDQRSIGGFRFQVEGHVSRDFLDGKIQFKAIMGKQTLADLSRNDQVEIKAVTGGG